MFWREIPVRKLLDGCFRIGHALLQIVRVPLRTKYRYRGKCITPDRPKKEPCRSKQLDQRGLQESFTPGAANGQLFVKRLPAYPHLGYSCVCIVI